MPHPVPTPKDPNALTEQFDAFVAIVRLLRQECPWDRQQTHESIAHLLIEESYETLDAIERADDAEFKKELGDLLLHVVMHSVIAEERNAFTLRQVIEHVAQKLVRRHPHVFGDVVAEDPAQVMQNWERLNSAKGATRSLQECRAIYPHCFERSECRRRLQTLALTGNQPRMYGRKFTRSSLSFGMQLPPAIVRHSRKSSAISSLPQSILRGIWALLRKQRSNEPTKSFGSDSSTSKSKRVRKAALWSSLRWSRWITGGTMQSSNGDPPLRCTARPLLAGGRSVVRCSRSIHRR